MSPASRQISLARSEEGRWVATDETSGTTGEGDSVGVALLSLGLKLGLLEGDDRTVDDLLDALATELDEELSTDASTVRLEALAKQVRERFAERGVSEDDVEDAIRWARSS